MPASKASQEHAVARASKIYSALKYAAEAGQTCPTNKVLAERFGVSSVRISDAISFLHAAGMIEVHRKNATRIVTICSSGKSTAGKPGKLHWSAKENATRRAA